MTKSLNDLPYQVYLENIVPVIDIKDAGNLSMTSKVLKNIFDSNEIWKYLYFKTNPPKISDKSIHIGPHSKYKHMKKEELLEKFSVRRPIYWPRYGNIYRTWSSDSCCCSGISKLVPNFDNLANTMTARLTLEQYPQSTANVQTSGTITSTTEKISVRGRGRAVKIRYTTNSVNDTPWRLGSQKLEIRPDGRR